MSDAIWYSIHCTECKASLTHIGLIDKTSVHKRHLTICQHSYSMEELSLFLMQHKDHLLVFNDKKTYENATPNNS